jgi:hypothetical protein
MEKEHDLGAQSATGVDSACSLVPALSASHDVCVDTNGCCRELTRVWSALGITGYNGKSASENVTALRRIADQLLIEATMATNALGCIARAQYQHAEVARLHIAIGLLKEQLIGYHGNQPLSEASGSAQSEAK